MKIVATISILLILIVSSAVAQFQFTEMTTSWSDTDEMLIPEEGSIPPETNISSSTFLGRLRVQDKRRFPLLEVMYKYNQQHSSNDDVDLRMAAMFPLPVSNITFKGIFQENNPDNASPYTAFATYVFGTFDKLDVAVGQERFEQGSADDDLFSMRAKYDLKHLKVLAGYANAANGDNRVVGGAIINLPKQFLASGLFASWEDDDGYSFNIGRFNKRGDFNGLPSFALNYVEVPQTYKWTNFRIMWGDAGIHYVRPTFDNRVFSGMLDIDVALMLGELIQDNYRHYDSPLVFKRFDEYGKVALRANFIETETNFRKFDANIAANPGWGNKVFQSLRGIITFERIHNPAFGWQDNRYHLTAASHIFGKIYTGVTYSNDFDEYTNTTIEFRISSSLGK